MTLLVLHDAGDEAGGAPWKVAFLEAGWTGPVRAPDLPGHAGAAPPEGGQYEPGDGAFALARQPAVEIVVGVGVNGWSAQLAGLAGRAACVVLVDGLGGPWATVREQVLAGTAQLRAIADDPEALAPMAPGDSLDPRLRHGLPSHGSRRMAFEAAAVMPVPVVIVESPASGTPPEDAEALAVAMAAGGTLVRVPDPSPATVARAAFAHLGPV